MARVVVVAFDGAQTLDVTGPAEVFSAAGYSVELASSGGGQRVTSSSLRLLTKKLGSIRVRRDDVIVVAGGGDDAVRAALADRALLAWLARSARIARWTTSVCSGAFILAAAGLLRGKRVTTHWSACDLLARAFPDLSVDRNAIFVRDGRVWTSAGVTTGIDMALALVEHDCGRALADTIAARLVLYVRRPGFQSQFSDALVAQTANADPLAPAIAWARAHLATANVDTLAKKAGLSVRTLHRRCLELLAMTPAKLIDKLRVEHARTLLSTNDVSAKRLAIECGFGNATRMRRAFEREMGMRPRDYRVLHAS